MRTPSPSPGHPAAPGIILATAALVSTAGAATPDWVNDQGVLRDAAGNPRDGVVDMTFRFFDQATGGNEIVVDRHTAAGAGGVTVSDGLFSVALGSGGVTDGAAVLPGDPYTTIPPASPCPAISGSASAPVSPRRRPGWN